MVLYTLKQRWEILRQTTLQKMPILAKKTIFSGEAHIDLGGYVNKQNCHIWGIENPCAYIEKPTQPKRVTVCVQSYNWAIFLRKWARRVHYVNGDRYWAMLNEFLFTKIEEEDIGNIWFQQNGAMRHTAEATLDVLRPVFEDRINNRKADVVWSPRSCDLTPLIYYLWGAVKDSVTPTSQRQLKL